MANFEQKVDEFILLLKNFKKLDNVFNPWKDFDKKYDLETNAPDIRCNNLRNYLLDRKNAKCILIAEAPGYQGCHFSGVPLTSERLILTNAYGAFKKMNRSSCMQKLTNLSKTIQNQGFCEPTATIVWKLINELDFNFNDFVFWNAFAFHPYECDSNILTNRRPTQKEIESNKIILEKLIGKDGVFPNIKIIPVGNVSENCLNWLNFRHEEKVRHPSYGGANDFKKGVVEILK